MFWAVGDSSIRTDTGWGCTLRCGQMMLAYSLILRHLGRGVLVGGAWVSVDYDLIFSEWRYNPNDRSENYNKVNCYYIYVF